MALKGEQFHNTYMPGRPDWMSPEHHTRQGPKHLTKLHGTRSVIHDGQVIGTSHGLKRDEEPPPVTDEEITTFDVQDKTGKLQVNNAPVPTPREELAPGTNRQGMLFDPYTGTGLPRDPTVSKEQRLAAVDHQLNLRGQGAPQLRETYAMGDEPVSEFYRPITRSAHGDKVPKPGEEPDRPKIKQGRGKRGGGHYQPRSNEATVQRLWGQKTVEYPTRSMTRPTKDATSTGTEWNPDWYTGGSSGKGKGIMPKGSKVDDEAMQPHITAEILKHSFHNPETGETLNPHTGPNEPVFMPWEEETPEEIARDRRHRYGNQIRVDRIGPTSEGSPALLHGGRREVTGTSGEADPFKHLGRFNPSLDTTYVDSWDTANTLKNLHEAGFQSELHRGKGHTGEESHLLPGVESEAQKANPDRPKNYQSKGVLPEKEYRTREEGTHQGLRDAVMLPTEEAEGFLVKPVAGGERVPEGDYRWNVDYRTFFHKRRIPSETETVERQYRVETEWPDASTAFHERGHAIDPSIGLRTVNRGDTGTWHRDPVMEGIADAATDRTIEYANVHEDALNPSLNPNRAEDVRDRKARRGYGSEHEAWKQDPLTQAIYSATRIHSAMSDEPNIPDRVDLVKEQHGMSSFHIASVTQTDLANRTLLGKLYHENEHVRDGRKELGFGRIGAQSAEQHVRRMEDKASAAEDAAPDETQMSFWPREGVNEW